MCSTLRQVSLAAIAAIAVLSIAGVHRTSPPNVFSGAALGEETPLPYSSIVSPEFAPLVSAVHTSTARVNQAGQHVELEKYTEMNKNEQRQLQLANDNLQLAESKLDEGNKLVKQRYIEALAAKSAVEKSTLEATTGKTLEAKNAAVEDTAGLSAQKKLYLDARDTYTDSTKLVAQYKVELKDAKAASAIAFAAYNAKKTAADEAKDKADRDAVAKDNFQKSTKAEAEVGEEDTSDGVARAQQMAQVTAKATQSEVEAVTLMHQASDLKAVWESKVGLQKTAQETFDAEVKRNAQLAIKSNRAQKDFVDASHRAAVEATGSADVQKKSKKVLDDASAKEAKAETSLKDAQTEAHRLSRIVDIRRVERDAQKAKAEAAEAAEKLQSAIFDVAQKAVAVERNKENTNRDATVATLKAEFEAAKLKAANAKKTADEIKADAEADGIRLETMGTADNRAQINEIPMPTEVDSAPELNSVSNAAAVGKSHNDHGVTTPNGMFDLSKQSSTNVAQDNVNRFLKTFNFMMMGDGTDKSIVLSLCNRMLQAEQHAGGWSSFPMRTEEFPSNVRPYICENGYGANSKCSLAPEESCCRADGCCMETFAGNAAMHCANPSGSHTHVALAHHFGLSEDSSPVFDADVLQETQGFNLPFATGARLESSFSSFSKMLAEDADAQKKPLVVTMQSMLWDIYRFSIGQVQPARCPECEKTPEALFKNFEEKLVALTTRVQKFTKAKYPGPTCLVLRTQFATHPAPAFGVPDWLGKMNSIIIRVGKQLNVPVFRYDKAIEAYNRMGNKWVDIFVDAGNTGQSDMLYHPSPATSEMVMAAFVEGIEKGLCDHVAR